MMLRLPGESAPHTHLMVNNTVGKMFSARSAFKTTVFLMVYSAAVAVFYGDHESRVFLHISTSANSIKNIPENRE